MKTKYVLLSLMLFGSSLLYAQNSAFKTLYEKYENEDSATVVSISKAMFNMIPGNINAGKVNLKNISSKIESLLILTAENHTLKEKMNADFKAMLAKDKGYEEMMRVKNGKSTVFFHVKKKGNIITELLMLVNDDDNYVALQLLGNFLMEDIKNLADESAHITIK